MKRDRAGGPKGQRKKAEISATILATATVFCCLLQLQNPIEETDRKEKNTGFTGCYANIT